MSGLARILAIIAVIVVVVGLVVSGGINTIPTDEEKAKAAWSEVQNQYQRRADLVPNLVETVKGYAKQEEKVLTEVVEARAKATSVKIDASTITDPDKFKQFQEAQQGLSGALGRLIALREAYPDLKSNQNFLSLQSQLEGTENRIAVARKDYIEAVRVFNTDLRTFPQSIYKAIFYSSTKPMETFSAAPENQAAPKVNFN
ncbi:LemA family protein [Labrys sp. KNU-23]|uniref:LemA family protein n=1 Tax=Labrys sp. KNU-23 TaxID=2789216 RepID=UPI0011ED75B9|nr:LemA family protein [Labrys sp. KNU-23]QEN87525.1 LemA family protein [Labrys sp. KNU-23]